MWTYNSLYHHGILGQKWGKRNGPPYPLDQKSHSISEKKAGWRKSLDNKNESTYNKNRKYHLTDKQKRAVVIGASIVGTALAVYGGYKLYQSAEAGQYVKTGKTKLLENLYSGLPELKRLEHPESISETIRLANPSEDDNNCSFCCIVGFLRSLGYDVTARSSTNKDGEPLKSLLQKCFKNLDVFEGYEPRIGRSRASAEKLLIDCFGSDASGVIGIRWNVPDNKGNKRRHVFNWVIKNGVVTFFDSQNGLDDKEITSFWDLIDTSAPVILANLSGCEIVPEEIAHIIS